MSNKVIVNEDIDLLTRKETCQMLRISQSFLDAHIKDLPKIKLGRRVLYGRKSVLDWLKSHELLGENNE